MENIKDFDEFAFMLGYMSKEAQTPKNPYAIIPGQAPQQLAAQQFLKNQNMVGKGTSAMANMDPSKRAMGTHLGVGALGALGGYMAGGDATSALLGAGIGALVSFLAHTFFGDDINKGWQYVDQMANKGTMDTTIKQINEQYGTQFDAKAVEGELELKRVDSVIQAEMKKPADEQNPDLLAEMNKKKSALWKQTGRQTNLDISLDSNQDGILDSQQNIGPDARRSVTEADANPQHVREVDPQSEYFPTMEQGRADADANKPPATPTAPTDTGTPGAPLNKEPLGK
jgi:hypothetical protein